MSDMGKGRPVDALDTVCKAHKECLQCASKQYGADRICLSDNVAYMHMYNTSKAEPYCTNDADTCERATCECDVAFAKAQLAVKNTYNEQYHHSFGNFDPTDQANCPFGPSLSSGSSSSPGSGSSSADKKCCNNADKSTNFKLYNANKQQCCSDGSLKELGQFC